MARHFFVNFPVGELDILKRGDLNCVVKLLKT